MRTRGDTAQWKDDHVLWSMRNDSSVQVDWRRILRWIRYCRGGVGMERLRRANMKGKIVITLTGCERGVRDSTLFRGKILTYYGRWT